MTPSPYLSVVVPVRDEEENLAPLHAELDRALGELPGPVELIFVDDGSRDDSPERLAKLAALDPRVRVLRLAGPSGQSAALDTGFRAARGGIVATLDADLQNDPRDLPRLLAALDGADVVNGVRVRRRDALSRRVASRVGNGLRNWLTGDAVTDVGCSLRVMRAEPLSRVKLHRGMHRFLPTLLRMQGARVVEIPVAHRPRTRGRSKYGLLDRLGEGLVDLIEVRRIQRRARRRGAVPRSRSG